MIFLKLKIDVWSSFWHDLCWWCWSLSKPQFWNLMQKQVFSLCSICWLVCWLQIVHLVTVVQTTWDLLLNVIDSLQSVMELCLSQQFLMSCFSCVFLWTMLRHVFCICFGKMTLWCKMIVAWQSWACNWMQSILVQSQHDSVSVLFPLQGAFVFLFFLFFFF